MTGFYSSEFYDNWRATRNDRFGVLAMEKWRNWTGTGYDRFRENGSTSLCPSTGSSSCVAASQARRDESKR